MIGDFVMLGRECYLQTNKEGTLKKLPKIKWYNVLKLWLTQRLTGRALEITDNNELAFTGKQA